MAIKALLTGITGQDGSYLAELLISKGYEVHGLIRKGGESNLARIEHIRDHLKLHQIDLNESESVRSLIEKVNPNEIYNLVGQSFVPASWSNPIATGELTAMLVVRMLDAIREVNNKIKFYQASSSEMFGKAVVSPQNETTPFNPRTPYGISKLYGHFITKNYRENYGIFAVSGILYNHESPRRSQEFVSRKITSSVVKIKTGKMKKLQMGNIDARRDWGYAKDYVEAMWLMLQRKEAEDFVIATGECHCVKDWLDLAFKKVGLDYQEFVEVNKQFWRPEEDVPLIGDISKAINELPWKPKTTFEDLVSLMVDADLRRESML
ncbi:GDP-mannose 4,6-dehydratase [bacterium F11]|nr:GDP-mannose 4,6-dehydratase [bacterium F11]